MQRAVTAAALLDRGFKGVLQRRAWRRTSRRFRSAALAAAAGRSPRRGLRQGPRQGRGRRRGRLARAALRDDAAGRGLHRRRRCQARQGAAPAVAAGAGGDRQHPAAAAAARATSQMQPPRPVGLIARRRKRLVGDYLAGFVAAPCRLSRPSHVSSCSVGAEEVSMGDSIGEVPRRSVQRHLRGPAEASRSGTTTSGSRTTIRRSTAAPSSGRSCPRQPPTASSASSSTPTTRPTPGAPASSAPRRSPKQKFGLSDKNAGLAFEVKAPLRERARRGWSAASSRTPATPSKHDEIDCEALCNDLNTGKKQIQTNVYANEPLGAGHTKFVPVSRRR